MDTATTDLTTLLCRVAAMDDSIELTDSDVQTLENALSRAPYFAAATVALLRHGGALISPERHIALQQQLALSASDRRTLVYAELGDDWANFYPYKNSPAPDTGDVIDTFLRTYGSCTPQEERQLEKMIFNPTPDYSELLARQEQNELPPATAPEGTHEALINAFILSQHPAAPREEPAPAEPAGNEPPVSKPKHSDDSLLSESLAKIFIKQGRYERAYEIISGLSLKFPKKSAYFADQLRFLQKLIINQRRKSELAGDGASQK